MSDFQQLKENRQKIKQLCPEMQDRSGIYIFYRTDEEENVIARYIGKSENSILGRCASHLNGYIQHIDLSLRSHKLYSEDNPTGWREVVGSTGIKDFAQWIERLEQFGYKNYWQLMNAKDYGIPQNRNRCFMVSLLGDYYYSFPKPQKLTVRLKDFLDKKVDEKYYLSDRTVEMFIEHTKKQQAKGNGFAFEPTTGNGVGKCITTREGSRGYENFIKEQVDGAMLGTSEQFNAGLCEEMSRSITTEGKTE